MSGDFSMGGVDRMRVIRPDGSIHSEETDKRLHVEFEARPVLMEFLSQEKGRPIYETRDFIKIIQPGERDILVREVREEDKWRWPRHWEAYSNQKTQVPDGTPLAVLYAGAPHEVEMLRALKIFTVEQLAGLTEQGIGRLGMGARERVQRAKDFLEAASRHEGASRLQQQYDEVKHENATLRDQLKELQDAVSQLRAQGAESKRTRRNGSDE